MLQLSSRILHHIPDAEFLLDHYELGSSHIATEVFKHLGVDQKAESISLLNAGITKTAGLGLRGAFFEAKVKLTIQNRKHAVRCVGQSKLSPQIQLTHHCSRFYEVGHPTTLVAFESFAWYAWTSVVCNADLFCMQSVSYCRTNALQNASVPNLQCHKSTSHLLKPIADHLAI